MSDVQRLYVRAPNWVGDFTMATAAFQRLRNGFPAAEIAVALRPYLRGLAEGAGWYDRLIDAPRVRGLAALRGRVRELREGRFDLAVVLPNSFETALLPFLAGVPRRIGYRQGRPGLLTAGPVAARGRAWFSRRGPRRVPEPMPQYYDRLLDTLGIPPADPRPRLPLRDQDREAVTRWLAERGQPGDRRIVLRTAGASYGASKLWLPERFAAVARHFAQRADTLPILLSGPAEVELIRAIATDAGVLSATDPVLPLEQLKALCERASLMITTDTGPRHVAVAFDVPVVCLMGPTDSRYTDYALDDQIVIQRRELPCLPCQRKVCPLGHHDCMVQIGVDEVVAAAESMLARPPRPVGSRSSTAAAAPDRHGGATIEGSPPA